MSQITKTARSTVLLAAGTVASVLIAGSLATTAKAETVYFGYEVSFREAKQMCNGMHGRFFETERAQYGCTGNLRVRKRRHTIDPKRPLPLKANARPGKLQNFTGRKDFSNTGHTGGGGGNGGANGGGSGAGGKG